MIRTHHDRNSLKSRLFLLFRFDAEKVIGYSRRRVLDGDTFTNSEKILSLSDRSAAFIVKGDRETWVIVHRLAEAVMGSLQFFLCLKVSLPEVGNVPSVSTEGNATDSPQLVSLVEEAISNTGSEPYREARRNCSSVESLMFTVKYVYAFGNLRRRGIDAVRIELLEKAIVHNLSRLAVLKKRRRQ